MPSLLLPFAIRLSDRQLVTAADVQRGAACGCICPGCQSPLLARQGTEREWHFAHVHATDCADGYEKSVHELAKQRIQQQKLLLLPAIQASALGWDVYGRLVEKNQSVMDAKTVQLDDCKKNHLHGEVTPDLTGWRKDREILVEITVFHRLMPDKQSRLIETGVPTIEIDLSVFKTQQATLERLDAELFENPSNRRWIWHPKLEEAKATVQAEVDAQIQAVETEWEARERSRPEPIHQPDSRINPIWHQARDVVESPTQATAIDGRRWRAGLPLNEQIQTATAALVMRTGISPDKVLALTGALTSRGMLVDISPTELAARWSKILGVADQEMALFLVEADYLL